MIHPSTFSIVAYDAQENAWGVAVASKFLAVGAVVPWARAGQGAVATQSYANTTFGPRGLELMASGRSAEHALELLIREDEGRDQRQVGLVDQSGRAAAYTGPGCYAWAGHITGPNFTCQGNILVGEATVRAMADTFIKASGELADRLVAALSAGEAAGGDSRGRQSAAVLVVRPGGGYAGLNDRYIDLRVDDDPAPVQRLLDLVEMHHLFFGRTLPEDRITIDSNLAHEIQSILVTQRMFTGNPNGSYDEPTRRAFAHFIGRENLEDRCDPIAGWIDPPALDYIRKHFQRKV
jgi:uncharacterized Ntn-hydrolase superfamily protein